MTHARWRVRLTGTLMALLLIAGGGLASADGPLDGTEDDLGARSLHEDSWSTPVVEDSDLTRFGPVYPMTPPMDELWKDPSYYADGCHANRARVTVLPGCTYGDPNGEVSVAVLGSSKIGQYFPALQEIALREGWSLRFYTKTSCAFVKDVPIAEPGYAECDTYNDAVREHLQEDPPDLVLTGGMRTDGPDGYANAWSFLEDIGVEKIAALWDTPVPAPNPGSCIASKLVSGEDLRGCVTWMPADRSGNPSMSEAADRVDSASFIDLRDWVCPPSRLTPRCAAVLGRAQIYSSGSHLSQGYAATLTDPIHQRLFEAGFAQFRPSVDRVAGADRYQTAALLSRDVEPGGRVFVASGSDYPDALAAAAKAGHTNGAVLLTRASTLPGSTREALIRLAPSQIVVAGGEGAISEDVFQELGTLGADVLRVDGPNRYGTAAAISTLAPVQGDGTVYVATGTGYADALAAAAQAGQREAAILLVRPDAIPRATAEALQDLKPRKIVVAGGTSAVSNEVVEELGVYSWEPVVRRGGATRYETAAALAGDTLPGSVIHVGVGTNFADSLAAAPASAAQHGAVLLVSKEKVPNATAAALDELDPKRVILAGGASVITEDVKRALIRLIP